MANQTVIKLQDGNVMPQLGLGVWGNIFAPGMPQVNPTEDLTVDEATAGRYLPFIGPDNIAPAAHSVYSFFRNDFNSNRPPYSSSGYVRDIFSW